MIVSVFATATLFRYAPMTESYPSAFGGGVFVQVWDRWKARVCLSVRPEISDVTGTACTKSEIQAVLEKIREAQLSPEQREQEKLMAVVREGKGGAAAIVRLRQAGFPETEIRAWASDLRARMAAGGAPKNLLDEYWGGCPYLGVK
jgi:hypothetical protein